jgi:2-octaprenyl-6-methoxyphenol hydroxylase
MALALMLAKRGMDPCRIALIDGKPLDAAVRDPRSIALSYGSRQLLEDAGAWPVPGTPINEIHVSRRGYFGRSLMTRAEHKVEALGYVARYGDLVSVLSDACIRRGITTLRPVRVQAAEEGADGVHLALDDGSTLYVALAVQAEGGLFAEQGRRADQRARQRDYGQVGVIARVSVSAPVANRAFERFTDDGPLALLPQDGADGHGYALVWCVPPERAAQLQALDDESFLRELGAAFGTRLGRFEKVSPRVAFPLGLSAEPPGSARIVAIGNAAQTLHPVAGQGLNLGLRDAAVLARLLARGATPAQVQAFAQERKADRGAIVSVTDTMARVFAHSGRSQAVLGLAIGALDAVRPARSALAELLMFGRR